MKVIILAGGEGTRLKSVVKDIPKPMADINGTPFLELLMQELISHGADEFVLCVSYLKDVIIDYFKDNYKGIPIKYSIEEEALGTGGAIKQAFDMYGIDRALVLNGDSYIKMNYREFYELNKSEELALALKWVEDASRYGLVKTENKQAVEFCEKNNDMISGYINAGIYMVSSQLFKNPSLGMKFSFEQDLLEKEVALLKPLYYKTEDYFIDIGIPESYEQACKELKQMILNKALFLDRDGVINVNFGHVYKTENCQFVEGIFELCKEAQKLGYLLIVVTNQAGIAKGKYSEADYHKFMDFVKQKFEQEGCSLNADYFCPFHIEGFGEYKKDSQDRKPNPGMILRAVNDFKIDLQKSILIGDKESDILAAKNAGVYKSILLRDKDNSSEKTIANVEVNSLKECHEHL